MGALVLIVVLIVMIVTGIVAWRSLGKRDDSVERHGRALETLRHITESATPSDGTDRAAPAVPARATRERPVGMLPPDPRRRRRWMERGPLVIAGSAALVVAIVVAIVVAAQGSGGRSGEATNRADRIARTPTSRATTTTTVAPPPTLPPPQLVIEGSTPHVAVAAPFTMTLAATRPCWVSVTTSEGTSLLVRTLGAGEQASVPGSGPLLVRLGNAPAATLTVNGTPVDLSGLTQVDRFTVGPG